MGEWVCIGSRLAGLGEGGGQNSVIPPIPALRADKNPR